MKEKALTKKQLQMLQDVNKFLFLKAEYNKLQDDFEYVSSKLNERLNHILYIISDSIGVKSPRILHWINIECDNDKLAVEEQDLGFQNEEEEISIRVQPPDDKDIFVLGLYPEDPFPMPSFPTWFFWESDKKIAAYCEKFKEEKMAKAKIAEDEEISAEKIICNIVQKLSEEEREFLVSGYGFRF